MSKKKQQYDPYNNASSRPSFEYEKPKPKGKKNDHKSKLQPASEVLQSILQNSKSPLAGQYQRWRIWHFWPQIVGESIAKNSYPVAYNRGTLYVWVKNAVLMQEMPFLAKPMIEKINEFLKVKTIRYIRFTQDRKSIPSHAETVGDWRDYLSK